MFFIKVHTQGGRSILAVCDKELIGTRLKGKKISFLVSKGFYDGDLVNEDAVLALIKNVSSANLIGNRCVGLLIENGIVSKEDTLDIQGQMHVQIYDISEERD